MLDIKATLKQWWNESVIGDVTHDSKKHSPTNLSNKILESYGMHQVFKYDMYDPDNGLYFNEGSIGFCLEIIPQTGANDEMVSRLLTMFTPISKDTSIQIQMFGNTIFDSMIDRYYQIRFDAEKAGEIQSGQKSAQRSGGCEGRQQGDLRPASEKGHRAGDRPAHTVRRASQTHARV